MPNKCGGKDNGVVIEDFTVWKCNTGVFAKTSWPYRNPLLEVSVGETKRMYEIKNAVMIMNKIQVYTIHDDSKLHVTDSILAPQIPRHLELTRAASYDRIAAAGACASTTVDDMQEGGICSGHNHKWCQLGDGAGGAAITGGDVVGSGIFGGERPVTILQRTFLDWALCFSQPWPEFSFPRIAFALPTGFSTT